MQSKSKFILSLMIAFLCAMILSQPVLAYRRKDTWALVETFSPKPPIVLFNLIIVCIVITVVLVILSFIVKGNASVALRLLGVVTSFMGASFSTTFFGDMFPGIILLITAMILFHFSGHPFDRSSGWRFAGIVIIALLVAIMVVINLIIYSYWQSSL